MVVVLSSDLNNSKSEDRTLVARKIRAINRIMRLTFFIINRLNDLVKRTCEININKSSKTG